MQTKKHLQIHILPSVLPSILPSVLPSILIGALLIILLAFLTACSSNQDKAAQAVEAYFQALQQKDEIGMINRTCAAWEADARTEYNSFAAVDITLNELSCQQSGTSGEITLVDCQGTLVASYGAEDLVLDFSERVFQVKQEGGEWRMCGYK